MVAAMPRLSRTGLRMRPSSRSRLKFCILRAPTWKYVDVGQHDFNLRDLHDLADDEQSGGIADFAQQTQTLKAHALEGVGRTAGLEGATAEKFGAGSGDLASAMVNICSRDLDRTGSGHDHDFFAAHRRRRWESE